MPVCNNLVSMLRSYTLSSSFGSLQCQSTGNQCTCVQCTHKPYSFSTLLCPIASIISSTYHCFLLATILTDYWSSLMPFRSSTRMAETKGLLLLPTWHGHLHLKFMSVRCCLVIRFVQSTDWVDVCIMIIQSYCRPSIESMNIDSNWKIFSFRCE